MLLLVGCLFLLLLVQTVSGFVIPNHQRQAHRHQHQHHQHVQPTTRLALSPAFSLGLTADQVQEKLEEVWATDVPSSLDAVINEAQSSLGFALAAGEKRLRVDVRTPGLDEQFEQTAIREKVRSRHSDEISVAFVCPSVAMFLIPPSLPSLPPSLLPPNHRPSSSASSKPSSPSSPRSPPKSSSIPRATPPWLPRLTAVVLTSQLLAPLLVSPPSLSRPPTKSSS